MESMDASYASLFISLSAVTVSILSFYFSIKSWKESNRPIVVTRVSTHGGGNISTALDLIIENTGNRPAKNVKLSVDGEEMKVVMVAKEGDPLRNAIEGCFSEKTFIPILENGRKVSNSFGIFTVEKGKSTWKPNSILHVNLSYEDLDGRKYTHKIPILIADDAGFAGTFWSEAK